MSTRHRFTAAAAVAGALAIAAPAINASADTGLAAHATGSGVGASFTGGQLPVFGGGQAGATAAAGPDGGQIAANAGLAGMEAGATAVRNVWQTGLGMLAPHQHR
jgi:hypothetical protein